MRFPRHLIRPFLDARGSHTSYLPPGRRLRNYSGGIPRHVIAGLAHDESTPSTYNSILVVGPSIENGFGCGGSFGDQHSQLKRDGAASWLKRARAFSSTCQDDVDIRALNQVNKWPTFVISIQMHLSNVTNIINPLHFLRTANNFTCGEGGCRES
jgi:hypothetical protein